jgi:RNA polymerase sigma-70 factor (ECF subfamily)
VELEARIESLLGQGDLKAAATLAVEGYGPEVLGFLVVFLHDRADAEEVFAQACENLWSALPGFAGRSSLRTWFYTLARHAAINLRRSPHGNPRRRASLSEITDVAEQVRARTRPHLRTDVKDRFAEIRDALDEEDRALLVLRVDRGMSWNDVARVLAEGESTDEALSVVSARLRKRFQYVKDEIRRRALAEGLLSDDEGE